MKSTITFKPAWWLDNGHLQTVFSTIFRQSAQIKTRRERIQTADNDFLDIDWYGDGIAPLVIILHGLTGSSTSRYVKNLQVALFQAGYRSAALNFRGCSGVPNNTSRCYHSGETGDLNYLYQTLRHKEPLTPIAVVGFSLGGNMLLKWLGENAAKQLDLFAAVSVCAPLVLDICATRLDSGFSKLYRNRLISELKSGFRDKHHHLVQLNQLVEAEKLSKLGDISNVSSFWQYDEQVIAPLYGFKSAADYYKQNSARQYLKHIRIPTLLIQAKDDPFMTTDVLPQPSELSAAVELEITQGGGHVGFISGANPFKPQYWLDCCIPEYLNKQLATNSNRYGKSPGQLCTSQTI
jgi:predicted alpha/beta-fold hydrolase